MQNHGEEIAFTEGSDVQDDPEMWWGLATPMDMREPCKCEARCECGDPDD